MKLIIVEGPDNTGKTTLINRFLERVNRGKIIHCEAPSGPDPFKTQVRLFKKLVNEAIRDYKKEAVDAFVFDRAWYGEYVYGQMYRGEDAIDIGTMIRCRERELRSVIPDEDIVLIRLTASSDFLSRNDDGLSISDGKAERIQREIELFSEVMQLSELKNKATIRVDNPATGTFRPIESLLEEFKNATKYEDYI